MSAAPRRRSQRRAQDSHPGVKLRRPFAVTNTKGRRLAKWSQKCARCPVSIEPGDIIELRDGSWGHARCPIRPEPDEQAASGQRDRWRTVTRPDGTTHRVLDWELE